ncbi:GNAT family N-acetyltransferase [Kribbella sp. NBC_01245]|uniref:GNAT family N-acetyltransferase n=1 Tax=Kribbella sp. NBC_01245 TaxID=2903578 RepID=UPI002E2C3113|nr:GNAT family N-acetyltransferase [Kribbella sp. NBC_01245]
MRPAIRPAVAADLDGVVALDAQCFGASAWSRSSWIDEFARVGVDRLVLVADEGAVVGYVVLLVPPAAEDPVDLTRIAVVPAERRTGIGAQLTTAALAAVPGRTVLLEVAEGNEHARRLYAAHGFVEISRRRGYYPGPQDALILSLEQKADR